MRIRIQINAQAWLDKYVDQRFGHVEDFLSVEEGRELLEIVKVFRGMQGFVEANGVTASLEDCGHAGERKQEIIATQHGIGPAGDATPGWQMVSQPAEAQGQTGRTSLFQLFFDLGWLIRVVVIEE